jgi:hypothetical protein
MDNSIKHASWYGLFIERKFLSSRVWGNRFFNVSLHHWWIAHYIIPVFLNRSWGSQWGSHHRRFIIFFNDNYFNLGFTMLNFTPTLKIIRFLYSSFHWSMVLISVILIFQPLFSHFRDVILQFIIIIKFFPFPIFLGPIFLWLIFLILIFL